MAKKSYLDKLIDDIDEELDTLLDTFKRQQLALSDTRARLVKERDQRAEAKKAKTQP